MGQYLDKLKRFEPAQPAAPQSIRAHTVIEPAAQNARPVYWESGDGRVLGPATPEFLAKSGDQFWLVTTFENQIQWINANQLRSWKAFEGQHAVKVVELVEEPR